MRHSFTRGTGSTYRAAAVLVAFVFLFQGAGLWLHRDNPSQELTRRTAYFPYSSYLIGADRTDRASGLFSGYDDAIEANHGHGLCPVHCGTHPPGSIAGYWVALRAVEILPDGARDKLRDGLSSALRADADQQLSDDGELVALVAGPLLLLGCALIVLPLFALARLVAGPELALPLAGLGALTPSVLQFVAIYDALYATAAAALLYLALRGLSAPDRPLGWGLAAGAALAALTYVSFGPGVLVLALLAMALAARAGALPVAPPNRVVRASTEHVARWTAGLGLGIAVPWLAAWLVGGLDVPDVLAAVADNHEASTLGSRPYWPFVLISVTEFAQLVGLPLFALVAAFAWSRTRGWNFYAALFLGLVLLLDLSGSVRGETGRIWMFLVPLALLAVYSAVGRGQIGARGVTWLAAAQGAAALAIHGRWQL